MKISAKSLKYTCEEIHCNFSKKNWGVNKKSINLSKSDEVPNIKSKVIGGCFLYWIKIADNMNEKKADIWIKAPPTIFDFNQRLGWSFEENSSYKANLSNIFIQQLI